MNVEMLINNLEEIKARFKKGRETANREGLIFQSNLMYNYMSIIQTTIYLLKHNEAVIADLKKVNDKLRGELQLYEIGELEPIIAKKTNCIIDHLIAELEEIRNEYK